MELTFPIGSVVIPAHNEAPVIRRCLDALLTGLAPRELDVVVSCNGCTDNTADIVRASWPDVRVIETAQASKSAALRAGEEALSAFPRIYLDADVTLPSVAARMIIQRLRSGPALAAKPPISYDTSRCSPLVRSYYRARTRAFSNQKHLWGGGIYAVSAVGRGRFGLFPDIIADDKFINQWFKQAEIEIADTLPATVTVPRRTSDLIRAKRRVYQGNRELQGSREDQRSTAVETFRSVLAGGAHGLGPVLDALTFLMITVVIRATLMVAPSIGWARDESSRRIDSANEQ